MLRLIQSCWEFVPKAKYNDVGQDRRGIYVLYEESRKRSKLYYNVLYIGMTDASMRARLRNHNRRKKGWTHF